jgi:hypothetical protein
MESSIADFLLRVRALTDDDRRHVTEAWRAQRDRRPREMAEARYDAFQALIETGREAVYIGLIEEAGLAYLPDAAGAIMLTERNPDLTSLAEWNEVASMTHEALDDALLGLVVEDHAPGPARRLQRSWRALQPND